MVYEPHFPQCPYRNNGGNHCSHKGCPKICIYINNPEKCDMYNEWGSMVKDDSASVETSENNIGELD